MTYSAFPNHHHISINHPMACFDGCLQAHTIPKLVEAVMAQYYVRECGSHWSDNPSSEPIQLEALSSTHHVVGLNEFEAFNRELRQRWAEEVEESRKDDERLERIERDYNNGQRGWEQY